MGALESIDKIERQTEETVRAALQPLKINSNGKTGGKTHVFTIIKNAHANEAIGVNVFMFWGFPDKNDLGSR